MISSKQVLLCYYRGRFVLPNGVVLAMTTGMGIGKEEVRNLCKLRQERKVREDEAREPCKLEGIKKCM